MFVYEKILKKIIKISEAYGSVETFDKEGKETYKLFEVEKVLVKPNNWMVSFHKEKMKFYIYTPNVNDKKFFKWLKLVKKIILENNYDYSLKLLWEKKRKLKEMREDVLIQKEKYEKEKKLLAKYLYKILQITSVNKLIDILRKIDSAANSSMNGKTFLSDKYVTENEKDDMRFDDKEYSDAEKKLAKILRLLDLASGGYPERKEDAKPKEYLEQARRIIKKLIKRNPLKVPYSEDPHIQQANFYSTVAEALTDSRDVIVANIASRLADFHLGQANDYKTDLDVKYLKSLENLIETVANMLGISKSTNSPTAGFKEFHEWLNNFDVKNIIKESTSIESKGETKYLKVGNKTYKVIVEEIPEEKYRDASFEGGHVCFMYNNKDMIDEVMISHLRGVAFEILKNLGWRPNQIGDLPTIDENTPCYVIEYPYNIYIKEQVYGPKSDKTSEERLREYILESDREFFSPLITKMMLEKDNPLRLRRMVSYLSKDQILRLTNVIKHDLKENVANKLIKSITEEVNQKEKLTENENIKECNCGGKCGCSCNGNCSCRGNCGCENITDDYDLEMEPLKLLTLKNIPKDYGEQKHFLSQLEFSKGQSVASQCERLFAGYPLNTCDVNSLKILASFAKAYGHEDMANEIEDYVNAVDKCNPYNYAKNISFEGKVEKPAALLEEVKRRYGIYVAEQCLDMLSGISAKAQNKKALEMIYDAAVDLREIEFSNFLHKAINS